MRFCCKKLIVALLLLGISNAQAGILLEPYFGYAPSVGALEKKLYEDAEISVSYGSWDLGSRAGYVYDIFMAGLDFDWRKMKPTYTLGDPDTKEIQEVRAKVQMLNLGIFAGIWLKDHFNFRASYYPLIRWKYTEVPSMIEDLGLLSAGDTWSGNGLGLAVGWRVYDWMAVNFEYKYYSYNHFNGEKVSKDERFRPSELLFSISLPFNLGSKSVPNPD